MCPQILPYHLDYYPLQSFKTAHFIIARCNLFCKLIVTSVSVSYCHYQPSCSFFLVKIPSPNHPSITQITFPDNYTFSSSSHAQLEISSLPGLLKLIDVTPDQAADMFHHFIITSHRPKSSHPQTKAILSVTSYTVGRFCKCLSTLKKFDF